MQDTVSIMYPYLFHRMTVGRVKNMRKPAEKWALHGRTIPLWFAYSLCEISHSSMEQVREQNGNGMETDTECVFHTQIEQIT